MATWPTIIDDDGSGTTGTPTDYALFQAIKTYIDGASPAIWQNVAPTTITDDVGNSLSRTLTLCRAQRISPTTIIWQVNMGSITLPVATASIWFNYLPFLAANAAQMNPLALSSFPQGYVDVDATNRDRFRVKRCDQAAIAAGSHYFQFTSTWEVI